MTTVLVETVAALREHLAADVAAAGPIGLVPTMGALHEGHRALIRRARDECAVVVVSVFVNPLQFDRADDLERYPRTLSSDVATCDALGVDVVFAPAAADMYPRPPCCTVTVTRITDHLCGRHRPGHFSGVATVVLKLLQIVAPGRAYFGEKDAQQTAVIRRLVQDFNLPTIIIEVPIVREADGLAVSSRNVHLSGDDRRLSVALSRALTVGCQVVADGEQDATVVRSRAAASVPDHPRVRLEYLEVVDPDEMQPVARIDAPVRIAGALWVGETRLIDNMVCRPPDGTESESEET